MGKSIYKSASESEKEFLLLFSIIVFAFIAVIYRYLPQITILADDEQPVSMPLFVGMLVPVGLSFMVLSAVSYVVDIYKGKATPGSLLDSVLFLTYFPKAVCGPVVLWRDFKPQLPERKTDFNKVSDGLSRIIIGYAKKAIIADTFAAQIALIDSKFATGSTDCISTWLLALLWFFRIYYDFSGYTDIAIGISRVFGFDIGENFDWPYLSASLTEYWRRWHISLGRWFREYIYIPLGGNRSGNLWFNLFITFLIAAAWHGWKLNIILWGALNGIVVIIEKLKDRKGWKIRIPVPLQHVLTILLVFFGWFLFRAADLESAGALFKALFISPGGEIPNFTWQFFLTRRTIVFLIIAALGAFGAFPKAGEIIQKKISPEKYDILTKALLLLLFAVVIMYVVGTTYTPFVYTQIP